MRLQGIQAVRERIGFLPFQFQSTKTLQRELLYH